MAPISKDSGLLVSCFLTSFICYTGFVLIAVLRTLFICKIIPERGRHIMPLETLQNGRYRILRTLGSGSMGEVYLVEDRGINRQVAIKVIRIESAPYPDSNTTNELVRLFERDAKSIGSLNNQN